MKMVNMRKRRTKLHACCCLKLKILQRNNFHKKFLLIGANAKWTGLSELLADTSPEKQYLVILVFKNLV